MRCRLLALWTPSLALCCLAACGTAETPNAMGVDTSGPLFAMDTGAGPTDSGGPAADSGEALADGAVTGGGGADGSAVDGPGTGVVDGCAGDDPTCDGVDDDCDGETDEDAATGGCDDKNACTSDVCDAATKACTHAPKAGPCDDGNACSTGDTCNAGACAGVAADCDDNNPCTKDQCHPVTGKCGYAINDGQACDDGDACSADDACKGNECVGGTPKSCPAGAQCTVGLCDKTTGQCTTSPAADGGTCEDGDPCTVKDTCAAGKCVGGSAKECSTTNPCLGGSCDPQSGNCVTSPAGDGTACDDANKCTQGDVCKTGACAGTPVLCDDSNLCTDDTCDLAAGCTTTNNTAPCDDTKPCTTKDSCVGGVCVAGPDKDCDDGNACTKDSCDASTGTCLHDGAGLKGSACSDGDSCTVSDTCDNTGKCAPGTAKSCDDNKPCTADTCDPKTGVCAHPQAPSGAACDDGSYCTIGDKCDAKGSCAAGKTVSCVDNNACTVDGCDSKTGQCIFQPFPDNATCDDGDLCSQNDSCKQGKCVAGKSVNCDDGNVCTDEDCAPTTGKCVVKNLTIACSDKDACTLNETCATGSCKPLPTGTVTTAFGVGSASHLDGAAATARVSYPRGLDTTTDGRLFLADRSNHRIRLLQPDAKGGTVSTYAGSGSGSFLDGAATSARFYEPTDVAWHQSSKTLFVADRRNHRIRKIVAGQVTTLAGSSTTGLVDGKGTSARFYYPEGITVAPGGVVYVSDTYNHAIRRVTTDGAVITVAGSTSLGYVNGKGGAARFYYPRGLTYTAGALIVADTYNHRLRRVTLDGTVTLFAGTGSAGLTNGALASARFYYPYDVASGPGGVVVVADNNNHQIRRISGGQVSTLAGSGTGSFLDGAAASARFYYPQGVAMDVQGQTWVGDYQNHRVRRVGVPIAACDDSNACTVDSCSKTSGCVFQPKTTGAVCTDGDACTLNDACNSAGQCTGKAKVCTDGLLCTDDQCDPTSGKCAFPANSSACNDGDACTVGEVCVTGKCALPDTVSTWVGNGTGGYANGVGATTQVSYPRGLARAHATGDVFLADRSNHRIRRISASGTISLIAGSGTLGNTDGAAASARFYYPSDVAVTTNGAIVYVADRYNHRIRKIASGVVSTLAGSTAGFLDGQGTTARFYYPEGLAVDPTNGSVIVADSYNNRIRRVTSSGATSTVAGNGSSSYKEGKGTAATFYRPYGVDVSAAGIIYVADSYNHRIRRILNDGTTQLIAGSSAALLDGTGANARFSYPSAVSMRSDGLLLIADRGNHAVRLVNPASGEVSTLSGGVGGYAEGATSAARFNSPYGVLALPSSQGSWPYVVSDYGNQRLRKVGVGGQLNCDDNDACTIDSCNSKTGCLHKAVTNCCQPVKTAWPFTSESEATGWTFRTCAASTSYYVPTSCGAPYVPNSATKGWQVWGTSPTYKSKGGALFYGQRAGPNFNFGASAGTALTPKMKVPTGSAKLEFSIFCGTESSYTYDKSHVFLYVNGSKVNVKSATTPMAGSVWYLGQAGTTANVWYTVQLDVSQYSGKDVQLLFYFNSGDSVSNSGKGVYVDDVKLIGSCPKV